MQISSNLNPSLVTETSWEVCNKIGGIYTVLTTKAREMEKRFSDHLVFIGPHLSGPDKSPSDFIEDNSLLGGISGKELPMGVKVRTGRWDIPGKPLVALVDFKGVTPHLNEIFGQMWADYGVDSLHAYGDYNESCAFAVASAIAIKGIAEILNVTPNKVLAHFDEWTTGMGLLYLKTTMPQAATVFTTHATSIGRSICGNGKPLYEYFNNYNGDQMARELNIEAKHSLEKITAKNADCFTTVSDVTARECSQLLECTPQVVTPNGFEPDFVPEGHKSGALRRVGRKKLLEIAQKLTGKSFDPKTMIIATSGRNEYRNKGLDLFLDSMQFLEEYCKDDNRQILAFVLVPAWAKCPNQLVIADSTNTYESISDNFLTHALNNPGEDAIACRIRELESQGKFRNLKVIYVPCYLDGNDGVVNIKYYDLLPALDITVFASYYEPWGYTPLESVAFSVPTVSTDKAGFGQWALDATSNDLVGAGLKIVERNDTDYVMAKEMIAGTLRDFFMTSEPKVRTIRRAARETSEKATWENFMSYYDEAYAIAMEKAAVRNTN
ncbi:MAG: glycogen/starch synthase [Clostridium sp.]|nr:glycogen/starch synthase [Prevotella sp.]MCM1429230.1 glycogen/starch synthase [Clostridium sp.]MCM1475737.1 glycogen/starch synthase [Muribaculaceae bacterium]